MGRGERTDQIIQGLGDYPAAFFFHSEEREKAFQSSGWKSDIMSSCF